MDLQAQHYYAKTVTEDCLIIGPPSPTRETARTRGSANHKMCHKAYNSLSAGSARRRLDPIGEVVYHTFRRMCMTSKTPKYVQHQAPGDGVLPLTRGAAGRRVCLPQRCKPSKGGSLHLHAVRHKAPGDGVLPRRGAVGRRVCLPQRCKPD